MAPSCFDTFRIVFVNLYQPSLQIDTRVSAQCHGIFKEGFKIFFAFGVDDSLEQRLHCGSVCLELLPCPGSESLTGCAQGLSANDETKRQNTPTIIQNFLLPIYDSFQKMILKS